MSLKCRKVLESYFEARFILCGFIASLYNECQTSDHFEGPDHRSDGDEGKETTGAAA